MQSIIELCIFWGGMESIYLPSKLFYRSWPRGNIISHVLILLSFQMKLFLVLSVVFLVSADARPRGGSWLGKMTYHFKGLLSTAKEMACESQWLPLKNFLSCDSSGPYSFCNGHDCPEFDEKKLNVSGKIVDDYTLRCYYKPYKWVSTSYNGNYDK